MESKDELESILASSPEVVIDWTAPSWCGPCQRFAPHYEKAAAESSATFVAVDIDKAPWAVVDYGVLGVPRVDFYRHGEKSKELQGRTVIKLLNEVQS